MSSPALPLPVMVAFAHASVQCLADDHSLNLLHIKGQPLIRRSLGDEMAVSVAAPPGMQTS